MYRNNPHTLEALENEITKLGSVIHDITEGELQRHEISHAGAICVSMWMITTVSTSFEILVSMTKYCIP